MLRSEFDALLTYLCAKVPRMARAAAGPSEVEYRMIEEVYTWHPMFDEIQESKLAVAGLYVFGGMDIIRVLLPKAIELHALDNRLRAEENIEKRAEIYDRIDEARRCW